MRPATQDFLNEYGSDKVKDIASVNSSGLHPTHDKVLLKLLPKIEASRGGIVLADVTKQKEQQAQYIGILVEAGATAWQSEEMEGLKHGDYVLHAKFAGFVVQGRDAMYRLLRVTEVVGRTDGIFDQRMQGSIPMPDNS